MEMAVVGRGEFLHFIFLFPFHSVIVSPRELDEPTDDNENGGGTDDQE